MCFLLCYACMNLNSFFLDFLKDPHWRPKWRWFHWSVGLAGFLLCTSLMFIIDWVYADTVARSEPGRRTTPPRTTPTPPHPALSSPLPAPRQVRDHSVGDDDRRDRPRDLHERAGGDGRRPNLGSPSPQI